VLEQPDTYGAAIALVRARADNRSPLRKPVNPRRLEDRQGETDRLTPGCVVAALRDARVRTRVWASASPDAIGAATAEPWLMTSTPLPRRINMSRYLSWLTIGLGGGFLVVATAAFSLSAIAWLAFAISIGTLVVAAGVAYVYRRHLATLVTAAVAACISAWTIVASLVFSQATVQNLALAAGLAVTALAVAGLTEHELSNEYVVHAVEEAVERDARLAAAA
jgi:hypothetical protein